jgi:uncharacterized FAD-dependent dehydrogenase
MTVRYDVVIIGAGPAGLFAAYELKESPLSVLIIDRGGEPLKRKSWINGVGGAGAFSDGKLNLTHRIGGEPTDLQRSNEDIQQRIDEIDCVFTELGAEQDYSGLDSTAIISLRKKAAKYGVEFIAGKQRHIGTDNLPRIMDNLYHMLQNEGIEFELNMDIKGIAKSEDGFVLKKDANTLHATHLIIAPGRAGAYWLRETAAKLGIEFRYGPIDVGLRLEFPSEIYDDVKNIMYDAKFRLFTPTHDDWVRTFCINPEGFVSIEKYEDMILVNGHAAKRYKSGNTNLALLSRVELTNPVEDTTAYGRAIVELANTIGGGKPLLQRLKDLREGRRSTWKRISHSSISPTLKKVTPGDISMALPGRIMLNLLEAIERINHLIPGIDAYETFVYAPEVKFYDTKYKVTKNMESSLKNCYVAGDASGLARGIVYSAVTGMLAAEKIKKGRTSKPD